MNTKRPYRSGDFDTERPPTDQRQADLLSGCADAFAEFAVRDSLGVSRNMADYLHDEARRGFPVVVLRISPHELSRIANAIEQERA